MRRWRTIIILLISLTLVGITACSPLGSSSAGETTQQLVQVMRGDLTVSVTGSGNIKTSHEASLSFGSSGKVQEILVKEGEVVNKGDALARLDTSSLKLARNQAQVALTQTQVALTQAQVSQQIAEQNLKDTQDTKDSLELALLNAQIATRTAQYNLGKANETYTWPQIEILQADVDKAKSLVEYATKGLADATTEANITAWSIYLARAQASLDAAEVKLKAMLSGYDTEEIALKEMQVEAAGKTEAQAQKNLDSLQSKISLQQQQVEAAKESILQARQSVDLAKQSLDEAQKQLDEVTITAMFTGVVANIFVKEGDFIPSPTVAPKPVIQLVDPASLELVVEVDEIDIPDVKIGQKAVITVDALPGAEFNGEVAAVYPLPIQTGGVVLYNVKINLADKKDSKIKIGMSASADIILDSRSQVLLVPSQAINEDSQGNPLVKVMVNGQIQERPVVTGISDDTRTEITSGLAEGDTVVVETKVRAPSSMGFF